MPAKRESVMNSSSTKCQRIAATLLVVASAMGVSAPASAQDCFDHLSTRNYTPWNCTAMPEIDRVFRMQTITWKGHDYLFLDAGNEIKVFNIDSPQNPVVVAGSSFDVPNVGAVCAKEKVNPKMQATVDAGELVKMAEEGKITGCKVGGPFALDNAVNKEAAKTKGIKDPMAGDVDILLMDDIESGNVLYKALSFLAGAKSAGVIVGATAPVVLTSRADSDETKLNSIALGVLMSAAAKK